jgi:heme ABC exporter ATP-binding subunit CcmA
LIETRGLTKRYGRRTVLDGIDITIPAGAFVALFGPNGAGKTTLLKILATLATPNSGTVTVNGWDLKEDPGEIRASIGVVSHSPYVYGELSVEENLRFFGRMFGLKQPGLDERIGHLLSQMGLAHRAGDRPDILSRGMKQRLAIARALLHRPKVLLLDEPHVGLDPKASAVLDRALRLFQKNGGTVIMTTHDLSKGLMMADRLVFLIRGRIARQVDAAGLDEAGLKRMYDSLAAGQNV